MFCEKCGSKLADGSRFCEFCGTPVSAGAPGQQPQHLPSKRKNKAPTVWILIAVILLAAVAGVVLFMMGGTTFGEEVELQDWNWCELTGNSVEYGVIRKAETYNTREIDDFWIELMEQKLRPTKKDLEDKIRQGEFVDFYMADESSEIWLWVAANEAGEVFVKDCGNLTCYTGGKGLYQVLCDRLYFAESARLADTLGGRNWQGIGVYIYDSNGETVDDSIGLEAETAMAVVDQIMGMEVKYGGGRAYAPEGCEVTLQLWDENEEYFYLYVYDDGNADIPFGEWIYGFYDCGALYEILVNSLDMIYQMG